MDGEYQIIKHRLQGIKQVESSFYNDRPADVSISLLVIHNISLPPTQYGGPYVEQLFTGKLDPSIHPYFEQIYQLQVSAHLFIRRTGEVIQFVPFDKRAWHAGASSFNGVENCNDFSIGIELEGCDFEPFTDIQYTELAKITKVLKQEYPIKDVVGHSDVAPDRKTDPGPFFNWERFKELSL
ncbi:1,6-anhydro-N-acetylmuramyl-L-alanine amidase AmpD [Orbaceae bacterium ac157xtp]